MYAFHTHEYVVWIILFFQYVINWIKLIESTCKWMTCCHRNLTRKKKESKKGGQKEEEKQMIVSNTPMFANCDGQDFKNHKSWS